MFEIHDRIFEIAQRYLRNVRKTGAENVVAICPFHRKPDGSFERSPSFTMSLTKGLWQCHSCKEVGSLPRFFKLLGENYQVIKNYEDLFSELHQSSRRCVVIDTRALQAKYIVEDPLPEAVLGFFDFCPTPLLDEGFTEETLRRFEVGFDPKHFRITYPIRDIEGNLMGVSGRTVIDDEKRYKVYDKEFEAFGLPRRTPAKKSSTLWNGHTVYSSLFPTYNPDPLVVVEGFKACMWLWQAGIKNVVALMGSTLSEQQKWLLERMGAPVYLMLDNNDAGRKGTRKIGDVLARSLPLFIVPYAQAQPSDIPVDDIGPVFAHVEPYYSWTVKQMIGDGSWHSEKTPTH